MPPFIPPPVIWHGVTRDVRVVDTKDASKCSVVVSFTRYGYDNKTQQRVEEVLETYVVADKLSKKQADALQRTVSDVCDHAYAHGYADCRKRH